MKPETLEQWMAELDEDDPPPLENLSVDEQGLRALMAHHFCELDAALEARGLTLAARHELMTAIAAHTMVENMVLHMHRLRDEAGAAPDDAASRAAFRAWMRRHGLG